jgi:hypothetical protein
LELVLIHWDQVVLGQLTVRIHFEYKDSSYEAKDGKRCIMLKFIQSWGCYINF